MASLTETAKAVLQGKVLEEGAYPEVSPGKISNPNPVDPSTASTGNAKTLKPGSKSVEGRHTNPGAADPKSLGKEEDLGGQTPTSVPTENLGAKASGSKDTSKSAKASVAAEPTKKLSEDEEVEGDVFSEEEKVSLAERLKALKEARKSKEDDKSEKKDDDHEEKESAEYEKKEEACAKKMDEEIEISEELEAFISDAIEQGLSEEEILAAIDENFEFISEEETVAEALEIGRAHV